MTAEYRRLLRPSLARAPLTMALPVLTFSLLSIPDQESRPLFLTIAVTIAGLAVASAVYALVIVRIVVARSRIEIDGDRMTVVQGIFRPRRFAVSDVRTMLTVSGVVFGVRAWPALLLLGEDRRMDLLVGSMWSPDQLEAVARALAGRGVLRHHLSEQTTPLALRSLDRRTFTWRQSHPLIVSLIFVSIVTVLVIGVVAPLIFSALLR